MLLDATTGLKLFCSQDLTGSDKSAFLGPFLSGFRKSNFLISRSVFVGRVCVVGRLNRQNTLMDDTEAESI